MSEPARLQNRLVEAFTADKPNAPDGSSGLHGEGASTHAHDFDEALDPAHASLSGDRLSRDVMGAMSENQDRMMRFWLAGGGLLAAAAMLALVEGRWLIVPAIILGASGLLSLLLALGQGFGNRAEAAPEAFSREAGHPEVVDGRHGPDTARASLLSTIHDALGDMAIGRNAGGAILHANTIFRDLVGDRHPEGKTCQELGLHFQPGPVEHRYDVEIRTPAGLRIFDWHDVVAGDPVSGAQVIQSIARDVTEERQTARRQEDARRRAELESENKSRLIATVAHEIRTPLSGLLGMGNLLAGTRLEPDQANYLAGIRQSGTALIQLVEDLLDFSTIEAGRFMLRPRPEEIRPLIETVTEMLAPRAHEKGLEIGTHVAADLPGMLTLDASRLRQVLYNVAGNAVKFTDRGGILLKACLDGDDLVIAVTDTGPGMKEAELSRIFNEFEQGDMEGAREMGVGLGLAISARILAQAGGRLNVASQVGKGTTFQIRLPVGHQDLAPGHDRVLAAARVLVLAPAGPAADGLVATLGGLGSQAAHAADIGAALRILADFQPTDIIVDHRSDDILAGLLTRNAALADRACRKILLVDPESRPTRMTGSMHDAWLIRPLRERSLIDVLLGRFQGLEHRNEDNDKFPSLPADIGAIEETWGETAGGLFILLGEDDPVNAVITRAVLEKAGHQVKLATSFSMLDDAMANGPRPNLILTDHSMPGGRGDTFLAALRQGEQETGAGRMPVIVLTADTSDATRRKLLASGANLVLAKPAEPAVLADAVTRLCRRGSAAA